MPFHSSLFLFVIWPTSCDLQVDRNTEVEDGVRPPRSRIEMVRKPRSDHKPPRDLVAAFDLGQPRELERFLPRGSDGGAPRTAAEFALKASGEHRRDRLQRESPSYRQSEEGPLRLGLRFLWPS